MNSANCGSEGQRDEDRGRVDNRYQTQREYGRMSVRIPVSLLGRYKKEEMLEALWGSHSCHCLVGVEHSKSG